MKPNRNLALDFLRFVGLLVIMVAHSEPPEWLAQFRNFGTPLLIVASALTISAIYRDKAIDTGPFIRRRIVRLLLPTWAFLTVFFLLVYGISKLSEIEYPFDSRQIIQSYGLMGGIGYVWIFKVYITLALITPASLYFKSRIQSPAAYFIVLTIAYFLYEALVPWLRVHPSVANNALANYAVFVLVPYSLLFLYGLRLDELRVRTVLLFALIAGGIFMFLAFDKYQEFGVFVSTQNFRFPPTLYYLSYALLCTNIIYLLCTRVIAKRLNPAVVLWLASNSLWIYLWHIFGIYIWDVHVAIPPGPVVWLVKAAFILGFGVACTWAQSKALDWLMQTTSSPRIKAIALLMR